MKKYFRKVGKKDGECMLLVASNGKPVILEATVWMPIHVLFDDKRNMVEREESPERAGNEGPEILWFPSKCIRAWPMPDRSGCEGRE